MLHAQKLFRDEGDAFWTKKRQQLTELYRALWISCQGSLMAPPVLHPVTGELHPFRVEHPPSNLQTWLADAHRNDRQIFISVDYLTVPPRGWVPDL